MANLTITNNLTATVGFWEVVYATETLTAAAAVTWPAGAVLARRDSDSKLVRFLPAGSAGTEIPKFVLTQELVFDAAGDVVCQVAQSGQVREGLLVDSTDTALTPAGIDGLRDFSIVSRKTNQLAELDNQ